MYRSSTQSCPTKAYVPQSETLNSLSAYHSGQGGGATCFISFPEYSVPANAAEASAPAPNRHNSNFFIYFSFWLSSACNTPNTLERQSQKRSSLHVWMSESEPNRPNLQVFFDPP